MKFKSETRNNEVEISELNVGDTFIDVGNFDEETVLMVVKNKGYDCHVEYEDDLSVIAAVNLVTGELWSYARYEEVEPVETEEIKYKRD